MEMAVSGVRITHIDYPIEAPYSFIMDGIITLPIALYGFLVFPDIPATTKTFYLTEEVSQLW
jgi:hypothetical protein